MKKGILKILLLLLTCPALCVAQVRISELPSLTVTGSTFVPVYESGTTGKVTVASILASGSLTYQPLDADLTAIAALITTSFGRGLLTQADAPAARSTLGVIASTNGTAANLSLSGTLGGDVVRSGSTSETSGAVSLFSASTIALNSLGYHPSQFATASGTTAFTGFSYAVRSRGRTFDLISPSAVHLNRNFFGSGPYGQWGSGTTAIADGTLNVTVSGDYPILHFYRGPAAPFCTVEINVSESGADFVGCGLMDPVTHTRVFVYATGTSIAGEVNNGVQTALTGTAVALTAPYKLAFSLTDSIVGASVDRGNGWELIRTWDISAYEDFTDADLIKATEYMIFVGGTGEAKFRSIRAGTFGQTGVSSQHPVRFEDGTPIYDGRKMYVIATASGLNTSSNAASFRSSHLIVQKWDVDQDTFEDVAHVFGERDGRIVGDSYGPLIFDRTSKKWRVFVQNTGDFGTELPKQIQYTSETSLLNGEHVLGNATDLDLPSGAQGYWDADLVRISGTWYAAYTQKGSGVIWAAMASSANIDGSFTLIGSAPSDTGTEGARWIKAGSVWRAAWCDAGGTTFPIYDTGFTKVADMPIGNFPTPTSHPNILPVPTPEGNVKWVALTFNMNAPFLGWDATYGDWVVLEASTETADQVFETPAL